MYVGAFNEGENAQRLMVKEQHLVDDFQVSSQAVIVLQSI